MGLTLKASEYFCVSYVIDSADFHSSAKEKGGDSIAVVAAMEVSAAAPLENHKFDLLVAVVAEFLAN
jgi:hypothetical protein